MKLKVQFAIFCIRYIRNWVTVLVALWHKTGSTILMRNGLVFHTPNTFQTVSVLREIFSAGVYDISGLPAKPTIVDVGAYIGTFALFAIQKYPGAKILCFEPEKENFACLLKNTKPYPSIHCINAAIGDSEGERTFFVRGAGFGTNSLYRSKGAVPVTVHCTTLKAAVTETVDLLKLDCEGAEAEIVRSLPDNIRKIVLEWPRNNPPLPSLPIPVVLAKKV